MSKRAADTNSTLPPKPTNGRYESLTLWRGVACLMLVLYHAAFYADHTWRLGDRSTWTLGALAISCIDRLAMGVPIFFVVSGYCIAANIDALRRRPQSLSTYFIRRFRRIYPPLWAAYALAILVTLLVTAAGLTYAECRQLPQLANLSIGNWIGNFTISESWLPHWRADAKRAFLLPNTWTLCYEEQFYAITGLLLAVAARRFFVAAYVIALATLGSRHLCSALGVSTDGFALDGLWIMFAEGILVYECLNYFNRFASRLALGVLSIAAIYGLTERILCRTADDRQFGEYLLAASVFAILLMFLRRWDCQIANHGMLKPLALCGKMSYSVFLTHYPIVVVLACLLAKAGVHSDGMVFLITVPLCFIVSLPVAWLFHLNVERRFLNSPVDAKSDAHSESRSAKKQLCSTPGDFGLVKTFTLARSASEGSSSTSH